QPAEALGVFAPALRVALADAASVLLRGRCGHFEKHAPAFVCPRIQHLFAALPVDDGGKRVRERHGIEETARESQTSDRIHQMRGISREQHATAAETLDAALMDAVWRSGFG